MLGIGVDIVEIARIKQILTKNRQSFIRRVFTPQEQEYCLSAPILSTARFAARFAAKEAVAKALGVGIGKYCSWQDIATEAGTFNKPEVVLSQKLNDYFYSPKILLSLSHEKNYAVAFATWITSKREG